MQRLPRIALGGADANSSAQLVSWALMDVYRRSGAQVQHFHSRACFAPVEGAQVASGIASRHLDSWLMSPDVCREVFVRGSANKDLAIVEGQFDLVPVPEGLGCRPLLTTSAEASGDVGRRIGPSLDVLCDWLDLPRLAVIDVSHLGECRLPTRPRADGLFLDGIGSPREFCRWQTMLEAIWGIPVLGALERLPEIREQVRRLPIGVTPQEQLCHALGSSLGQYVRFSRLQALAARRGLGNAPQRLFRRGPGLSPLRVALAFDEAFHCYFVDALELLELRGAQIVEFSPLRDEALPDNTDLVYLGCGHPERYARELAANHCIAQALRTHLCSGRRIYAEGGGLAYLCQHLQTPDGRLHPMVGLLPAIARLNPKPASPQPVEIHLGARNWLGDTGTALRGYRNTYWILEPANGLCCYVADRGHEEDLVGRGQAIGSRVHLNFALQPDAFHHLFMPAACCAQRRAP
jgi:cobyrinic acid a,c-diamide synthase